MGANLAERDLKLTYIRSPSQVAGFDPYHILDELCDDGGASAMLPWQNGLRLCESDHLVLATALSDGRCLAALAANELATEWEPFLFIDAAYIVPMARASHLLQRMIAFVMLRIAGLATLPTVIAACVQTPCYADSLYGFSRVLTGAAAFPTVPGNNIIDLHLASQARRIARAVRPTVRGDALSAMLRPRDDRDAMPRRGEESLVVVDLSASDEATILDDALKLYRSRAIHASRRAPVNAMGRAVASPRRRLRGVSAV